MQGSFRIVDALALGLIALGLGYLGQSAGVHRARRTIAVAFAMLILVHLLSRQRVCWMERFAEPAPTAVTAVDRRIKMEEDPTAILPGMTYYASAFSSESYSGSGSAWNSIASGPVLRKPLLLSSPVFSRSDGFSLGSNTIAGPMSHELGISFSGPYTLFVACMHSPSAAGTNGPKTDVDILKLYGNSGNNNGVRLFLAGGTMRSQGGSDLSAQTMFQYANNAPAPCVATTAPLGSAAPASTAPMDLKPGVLMAFFVVVGRDSLRVLRMDQSSRTIQELLKMPVAPGDVTFSNKEMTINGSRGWPASLFSFGLYDRVLADQEVAAVFKHICALHARNSSEDVVDLIKRHNKLVDDLEHSECPFDAATCAACGGGSAMMGAMSVASAGDACRQTIAAFCAAHPTDAACRCYDPAEALTYSSVGCSRLRSLLGRAQQPAPPAAATSALPPSATAAASQQRAAAEQRPPAVTFTPVKVRPIEVIDNHILPGSTHAV